MASAVPDPGLTLLLSIDGSLGIADVAFFFRVDMQGSPRASISGNVLMLNKDAEFPPYTLRVFGSGRCLVLVRYPGEVSGRCLVLVRYPGEVGARVDPGLPLGSATLGSQTGDSAAGGSSREIIAEPGEPPPSLTGTDILL